MADTIKLEALVNVPGELYGGKPGERVEKGESFEVADKKQADALKKAGYAK